MNTYWDFSPGKIVFLYLIGMLIGGALTMTLTGFLPLFGGVSQIVSAALVTVVVVMSCRKKTK